MKKSTPSVARRAVLLSLSAIVVSPVLASVAVVSNLEAGGETASIIRDSHGAPLAAGCRVQLATFGEMLPEEIAALAAAGPSGLLAQATFFGSATPIATGSDQPGTIEFAASAPLVAPRDGLHALVFNAVTPESATEVLVVRLPGELQADSLSGLEGHRAVHFEEATVVFGERTEKGFFTRISPAVGAAPYEAWMVAQLGEASSGVDRLPEADPDHDGLENFLEYAMGSLPGDGSSVASLTLRRTAEGTVVVRYLRRADDPSVISRVEHCGDPGADTWSVLASPVTILAGSHWPAPDGCEWVEQSLPPGERGFARFKAVAAEETP